MPDERRSREGYLVMADIAGYTAFFTGTELEHASGIIEELTTPIRDRLAPPLRFVKLEGDAVFCYADAFAFEDGERLLELLEVCYCDFSDRLFDMARTSTCGCAACAAIDMLDLKFVAHFGAFMVQDQAGVEDLAGPESDHGEVEGHDEHGHAHTAPGRPALGNPPGFHGALGVPPVVGVQPVRA